MGNEWALMRIGKHSIGDYLALGAQLKNTPGSEYDRLVRRPSAG